MRINATPGGLALVTLCACSQPAPPGPQGTDRDRDRQARREAWYREQEQQDCPRAAQDHSAVNAVRVAYEGKPDQRVHGARDPYNRREALPNILRTRPNPHGQGTIVTGWRDEQRGMSADFSRRRIVWLVLNGTVYPLNGEASAVIGRLFDGLPPAIQKRAGLVHSYKPGQTMLDQLGIDEYTYIREFSGNNPFPQCR
jgi:hypothetical protein